MTAMPAAVMEPMEPTEMPTTESVTSETPEAASPEPVTPEMTEAMASESATAESNFLNAVGFAGDLQFNVGDLGFGRCGEGKRR